MKYYLILLLLWSFGAICRAESKVVLNLTDGVTWKNVFESGFRPRHLSDGLSMCRQYDVDLWIELQSGMLLSLGRGDVDFSVKENDLLVGISFFGRENRSLAEARQKSEAFAKMFGENVTQRAALNTFQVKHEVDYSGRKIDPPKIEEHVDLKTTTNAAKIRDFSIIYSFKDSYLDDLPLVERLSVALKSQEAKRTKRLTEKIRPPEGYEHISLEPDLDDVASKPESSTPDTGRGQDKANIGELGHIPKTTEEETSAKQKPNFLPWIIGGLLMIGILALLIKASMRAREP